MTPRDLQAFLSHPWVREELRTLAWVTGLFGLFLLGVAAVTQGNVP